MMSQTHEAILRSRGARGWNEWRQQNRSILPDLRCADFGECREHASRAYTFYDTNLRGACLERALLYESEFFRTDLQDADLSNSVMWGAELQAVNCRGANLKAADLRSAEFIDSDLTGATLKGTILTTAVLRGVTLVEADLRWANLSGTVLEDCDLEGAILDGTVLGNVRLKGVKNLESCVHQGPSIIDHQTIRASEHLPIAFLRGCGTPEALIEYLPSILGEGIQVSSCFISYGHTDRSFARRLYSELQSRGIRCWLDEHDIRPGDRLLDAIDRGIQIQDKLLLCCSKDSLESWWVKDEIRKAQERERREGRSIIIPLDLDGYLLSGWRDGLASDITSRYALGLVGWDSEPKKFNLRLEQLSRALRAGEQ